MLPSSPADVRSMLNAFGGGFGDDVISDEAAMVIFSGRPLVNRGLVNRDGAGRRPKDDPEEDQKEEAEQPRRPREDSDSDSPRGKRRHVKDTARGRL